jgi:hypothetical protein
VIGEAAGRVDIECSRRAAMGGRGTMAPLAQEPWVAALTGRAAHVRRDYHCRGAWLVMGLGPCDERAHLLRRVVVTRRALYQRPEGRDVGHHVARVPWARGVDAEVLRWQVWQIGNGWTIMGSEVQGIGAARTVGTGSKEPS